MDINKNPVYDEDYVTLGYLREYVGEAKEDEGSGPYSKNFGSQPTPPYHVNDTWTDTDGSLYVCTTERLIGDYDASDWTVVIDTAPYDRLVENYGDISINMLKAQVYDNKIESFVQATDPANDWITYVDKETHLYDFWRDTSTNNEYVYVKQNTNPITYAWALRSGTSIIWNITTGHKNIFATKPTEYDQYDLWLIDDSTSSEDIPTGMTINDWVISTQGDLIYNKDHWVDAATTIDLTRVETRVYNKVETDTRLSVLKTDYEVELYKTANSIESKVSDVRRIAEDAYDNAGEAMSAVSTAEGRITTEYTTAISQMADSVKFDISQTYATSNDVNNLSDKIDIANDNYNTIIRTIFADINGLHIKLSGSNTELLITESRISFLTNGTEVAYMSNNEMSITDSIILNKLSIKNWEFKEDAAHNLNIKWKG